MPLPPMVSYAQNAEDVVLRRVFAGRTDGFYVDVGACVPVEDSVTLHFYEQGWRGVNVEPDPRFSADLAQARQRDVTVQAAVGLGQDPVTFYPTDTRGLGTLDEALAARRGDAEPVQVPQVTLASVLTEHAPAEGVDFLKVDVEGWEAEVLASADWTALRPRVVVVEAVDAGGAPVHEAWEPDLLAAGYRFGLFDGLNRFYCREEDAEELLPLLGAPANVLDNWRPAREVSVQVALEGEVQRREQQLDGLRVALDEAQSRVAILEGELAAAAEVARNLDVERADHARTQAAHAEARAALEAARSESLELGRQLGQERAAHAGTRGRLVAEQAAHADARAALLAEKEAHARTSQALTGVLASTSWRITSPVRDASRLAKVLRKGPVR